MILVDTSVWADHFRRGDPALSALIGAGQVLMHPFVLGELALGNLRPRSTTVAALQALPRADIVAEADFLSLIVAYDFAASGIGYVDAHLIAATLRAGGVKLWTRDKRLAEHAQRLEVHWRES